MPPASDVLDAFPPVSPEEARAALERLLASRTLERAARLQDFLRFICELTLNGEGERINESLIAIEVFGRENHSSSDDSAVRRQAHSLREKLQRYYGGEGRDDRLRVELPIGRYVPLFRRHEPAGPVALVEAPPSPAEPPSPAPAAVAPGLASGRRAAVIGATLASTFGLGTLAGGFLRPRQAPIGQGPPLTEAMLAIWDGWLRPGTSVVLCLSTPPTALYRIVADPDSPEVARGTRVPEAEAKVLRRKLRMPDHGILYSFPDPDSHTKHGEAAGAAKLAAFFARAGVETTVQPGRMMTTDNFRRQDVVVFGRADTNAWTHQLLAAQPIRFMPADRNNRSRIFDRLAKPDQPDSFYNGAEVSPDGLVDGVALVSKIPAFGDGRRLLLVSGLMSAATEMAVNYLIEPARARLLHQALTKAGVTAERPYFQAVIQVRFSLDIALQGTIGRVRAL